MKVQQYSPSFDVRVWPFDGGADYTILHASLKGFDTSKSLGSPAGTFAVHLTSARDTHGRTWAQIIRPMDYLEIYARRTGPKGVQSGNELVMRCFVDNVIEDAQVNDASVSRTVTINGRDFGKVLIKRALVFANEADPLSYFSPENAIGSRLGVGGIEGFSGTMPAAELLYRIRDFLLNDPTVGAQFRNNRVPALAATSDIPDSHVIPTPHIPPTTGSIWNFLQQWQGKPFNEMFIRDDHDKPRFYWRQAPLRNKVGEVIPHGKQIPVLTNNDAVSITTGDIIHSTIATSDNEAYCYYFTYSDIFSLSDAEAGFILPPGLQTGEGTGDVFGSTPGNQFANIAVVAGNPILRRNIFARYGFAALKVSYPIMPIFDDDSRNVMDDVPPATVQEALKMNVWMHEAYSPNPAFESGTLVVKGLPQAKIGSYITITDQDRLFYIEAVSHGFTLGNDGQSPSFQTTLTVTRGTWLKNTPYPEMQWL